MILIPLANVNKLEMLTRENWCIFNIGRPSPTTWFTVNAVHLDNVTMSLFREAGLETCIVICKAEDAVAFKLRFGI